MEIANIVQWLLFGLITILIGMVAYFGRNLITTVKELTQAIQTILISQATHSSSITENAKDILSNKKNIDRLDDKVDSHEGRILILENTK